MTPRALTKKKFPNGRIGGGKHIPQDALEERIGPVAPDLFLMKWPPSPAFVAKVQRELFPQLPLSGESLLTVLNWIRENIYDRQNGNTGFVSHGSRLFRLIG